MGTETNLAEHLEGALGRGWSTSQTVDFIERCFDRDTLLQVLLGFAEKWIKNRMVLVLGNGHAKPYLIDGWSELSEEFRDLDTLRGIQIEVPGEANIFDPEQVGHTLAERPEEVGLGQLFVELTLFPPDRLLVQTVLLGSRPSMAIIGEPRQDDSLPPVEPLELVAGAVGSQLEEIVLLAKAKRLPPKEERIPPLPEPLGIADDADDAADDDRPAMPGLEAHSSLAEDSDPEPDEPAATAFGIPFADETEAGSRNRQPSAVQVSSPGVGEDSSVSIIPPVDVNEDDEAPAEAEDPKKTLSGGFSVSDVQKGLADHDEPDDVEGQPEKDTSAPSQDLADALAEPAAPSNDTPRPARGDAEQTAPSAQILRPISLKSGRKQKTVSDDKPSPEVEDIKAEPAASPSGDHGNDQSDGGELGKARSGWTLSFGSPHADEADEDEEEEIDEEADEDEEEEIDDGEELREPDVEPLDADEEPVATEPVDENQISKQLEEVIEQLDEAAPPEALDAAQRLRRLDEPSLRAAMRLLDERFPGRLFIDRYQYPVDTLPPIEEHGPVLAALAASGRIAVAVARSFLDHTSVELRFYATYLFTVLPVDDAVEPLIPRLFDRDQQTREIAKSIVLGAQDQDWFTERVLPLMHDELAAGSEDLRVEVAADLLGAIRDRKAVPHLIDGLDRFEGRVKDHIHAALQRITYKSFVPSVSEWKNWWTDATAQSRYDWVITALNSNSADIREMAFEEIDTFEDLDLNYHPDQPAKLRARAQEELREWLNDQG
ncbi:MAG: HEAT repeat domain-containing protein [Persicimonas sp.]